MTGNEHIIVTQRQQFFGDGIEQVGMVALRKVSATNGTMEQHVTYNGQCRSGVVEHHMARCMARTMQYSQRQVADRDSITIDQPLIRGVNTSVCGNPNMSDCAGRAFSQKLSSFCGPTIGT